MFFLVENSVVSELEMVDCVHRIKIVPTVRHFENSTKYMVQESVTLKFSNLTFFFLQATGSPNSFTVVSRKVVLQTGKSLTRQSRKLLWVMAVLTVA